MSDAAVRPVRQRRRIAVMRGVFVLALPVLLLTRSAWPEGHLGFEVLENAGVLMVVAAVLGRLWAILYIGSAKNARVVDQGPYSVCRHPLYLFSTVGVAGFGLMLGSLVLAVGLAAVTGAVLSATASREERYLRAAFGPAYAGYAARVPRIWPAPRLYATPERISVSVPVVRRNLADALAFLSLIPVAELLDSVKPIAGWPSLALW